MNLNLKQKVISGFAWTGMASAVGLIINLIQLALMSRYMTKEEIGILSILTVIIGLASRINIFGPTSSIIHFQDASDKELNSLFWLNLFSSILICIAVVVLAPMIANYYELAHISPMVRIFAISVVILALGQQFNTLFQKQLSLNVIAWIDILQKAITLICFILYIVFNPENLLFGLIVSILIGSAFRALVFLIRGAKIFYTPSLKNISFLDSKRYLNFNIFQMSAGFVSYLSSNLDKFFLAQFYGMDLLGIYEMAFKLIQKPIAFINPIFNTVSFPLFSLMQENKEKLNRIYIYKIEIIAFILIPVFFGLYIISEEFIQVLYGTGWEHTAQIIKILWVLGLARCIANPMGSYLLALGKPNIDFYLNIYRLIVTATIFYIGGRYLSFENTIILFVAGSILLTIPLNYIVRHRLTKMSAWQHIRSYLVAIVLSSIMVIILYFIKSLFNENQATSNTTLAMLISSGILLYVILNLSLNKQLITKIKNTIKSRNQQA